VLVFRLESRPRNELEDAKRGFYSRGPLFRTGCRTVLAEQRSE